MGGLQALLILVLACAGAAHGAAATDDAANSYVILRFRGAEQPTPSDIEAIIHASPVEIKLLSFLENFRPGGTGKPIDAGWGLFEAATPADAGAAIAFFAGRAASPAAGSAPAETEARRRLESAAGLESTGARLAGLVSGAEGSHGRVGVAAMPAECTGSAVTGACLTEGFYPINAIKAPVLWKRFPAEDPRGNRSLLNYMAPANETLLIEYGRKRMTIIDTGVDWEHIDLINQVDQAASVTYVPTAQLQSTPAFGFADRTDPHGTLIAGIIGAEWSNVNGTNGTAVGIIGNMYVKAFNPSDQTSELNAALASCRPFPQGQDTMKVTKAAEADVVRCLNHALSIGHNQVVQASIFFQASAASEFHTAAMKTLCDSNSLVIAAAGNGVEVDVSGSTKQVGIPIEGIPDGPRDRAEDPVWPANFAASHDCVLTVANVARPADPVNGPWELHMGSNYGDNVKIAAPCTDVDGLYPRPDKTPKTGGLRSQVDPDYRYTGTSCAAAYVGGAALLLANAFPGAKAVEVKNCLIESAAKRPVQPVTDPFGVQHKIAGGLLDVDEAYNCLARLIPRGPGSGALGECPANKPKFGAIGGIDFVKPTIKAHGQGPPIKCFLKTRGEGEQKKEFCFNVTSVLKEYSDNCNSPGSDKKKGEDNLVMFKFSQWQVDRAPSNVASTTSMEEGPKNVGRIKEIEKMKGNELCLSRAGLSTSQGKHIFAVVFARDRNGNEQTAVAQIKVFKSTNGKDDCPRIDV